MIQPTAVDETDRPASTTTPGEHEALVFDAASLKLAADALPWQRSLRWDTPRRERRVFWLGLGLAMVATVLELGGFALGMHSYRSAHWQRATAPQVITVALLTPDSELPPPPPEPEPPIVVRPSRIAIAPPAVKSTPPPPSRPDEASDAMRARLGSGAVAAPRLKLFNADGSVQLDGASAPIRAPRDEPPRTERAAAAKNWARIEERGNPLNCRKTRFADAFAPDESLGDKVSRKYLAWVGLADPQAIAHRAQRRAESGGCEPAP